MCYNSSFISLLFCFLGAMTSLNVFIAKSENWFRLVLLVFGPIRDMLLDILHSYLPRDPVELFKTLSNPFHKSKLINLKRKGILRNNQWEILFTTGRTETRSDLFDITLIILLIETCTSLKPTNGNWRDKNPPITDQSIAAFIIRIRELRNYLHHYPSTDQLNDQEFQLKWNEGVQILTGLSYAGDMTDVHNLETGDLDPKDNALKSIIIYLQVEQEKIMENLKENTKIVTGLASVPEKLETFQNRVNKLEKRSTQNAKITEEVETKFEEVFRTLELLKEQIKSQGRYIGSFLFSDWSIIKSQGRYIGSFLFSDWSIIKSQGRYIGSFLFSDWSIIKSQGRYIGSFLFSDWSIVKSQGRYIGSFLFSDWSIVLFFSSHWFSEVLLLSLIGSLFYTCPLIGGLVTSED